MTITEAKPAKVAPLTITVTLDKATYDSILKQAADDDRTPAKWVARYLRDAISA